MLLRRISQHVSAQNWVAVGIDFAIVVIGVFVGLQVSNWNDARQHERTSQTYIERVQDEILSNKEDMLQRAAYFEQVRAHGLKALEALDHPREDLGEQFIVDIYQASQHLQRRMGRDTYNEILSVGATNAISDAIVRKRLANFYRSIEAQIAQIAEVTPYRETLRRTMPYATQVAVRSACDDVVTTGQANEPIISLPETCDIGLTQGEIDDAVAAILEADIKSDLIRRLSGLDAKLIATRLIIERVELLNAYLEDVR